MSVVLVIAVIFMAHTKFHKLLIERLALQAELVANTVNYAADGLSRSGELQRIVTSLGAEREINMILVATNSESTKIIASTKNIFLGESLEYLQDEEISAPIYDALKTKLKYQHFDKQSHRYEIALPLTLITAHSKMLDEKPLTNAVVFVQLDSKRAENEALQTVIEFTLSIFSVLAILVAHSYFLLKCHVLTPLTKITQQVNVTEKVDILIFSDPKKYDEINVLNETLNEALSSSNKSQQILEHQKIELQNSRDQFAALVTNIPGITFRCALDADWTMFFMSGLVEELTGYPLNDFIQNAVRTYASVIYPDDSDYVNTEIDAAIKENRSYKIEYRVLHRSGEIIWVHECGRCVADQSGEICFIDGFILDISERKAADAAREYLLQIINDSADFIAMSDMQANLKYINLAGKRMVGLPPDANVFELRIDDFHSESGGKLVKEQGVNSAFKNGFWRSENTLLHKNGSEISVSQILTLHRDANGKPYLLSTIMRDISKQKDVEKMLFEAKTEAESLAKSKSEFLANMSHEIRTPMNAIIGLTQLALNEEMPNGVRNSLEKIYSSAESLLGILNDILDFSKMDAGKLAIETYPFNLVLLFRNLHNLFSVSAQKKNLEFKILSCENVPTNLLGDELRIQQVLSNLLGNAIKFTDKGSVELNVTLIESQEHQIKLRFSVSDTGIGIKKEHQEKLFNAFHQADTSITRRFGGTGLGLTIGLNLLNLMDSHFELQSAEQEGTTIYFDLWLGKVTENNSKNLELESVNSHHQQGILSEKLRELGKNLIGLNILLAEDNLLNQEIVSSFLKLSGINVDTALNGLEVLAQLEKNTYNVILMDVNMPEMSGIEATEQIRAQSKYEKLPIIALTAGVTVEEKTKCFTCGMNNFVAKPVNPEELINVLLALINSENKARAGNDK